MGRSAITLQQYLMEIRHEINREKKTDLIPDGALRSWAYKDICESVLRLGAIINNLYRTTATIAITSAAGHYDASVSHTASAVTVTGFSGLTPDAWKGGSILHVKSDIFYAAQMIDNAATTVTISVGTDLPAITNGAVMLTANNSNKILDISSLEMISFAEPIWEVLDNNDDPIEECSLEFARSVNADKSNAYDSVLFWTQVGQVIHLAIGSGGTASGNFTVGYYARPTEATADTDTIDFPLEYHDLAQQATMIRVLKKLDKLDAVKVKEADLKESWSAIEGSNLTAKRIDQQMGERS